MIQILKNIIEMSKYEYFRYLFIGILSNLISFIIFFFLLQLNTNISIASAVGMLTGILNTYTLGRKYIKKQEIAHSHLQLVIFTLYYSVAIFVTSGSIELLSKTTHVNEKFAWLICNVIASLCNFLFISKVTLVQK